MKKTYTTTLLLLIFLGLFGCGGSNNYDGKTGLISSTSNQSSKDISIKNIYDNVILRDINSSYTQSLVLISSVKSLNDTQSMATLETSQKEFKKLALLYKRVESTYVAGRESDDMRDIADFYLEQFIFNSKGDTLFNDLQRIFNGTGALYKNSHKGLTALEYALFDKAINNNEMLEKMNSIRLTSALTMAKTISQNLLLVKDYYENKSTFLEDADTAISLVLNQLVDNAYKLKEKRLGDGGGFTLKYKDNPDVKRLEYYKSTNTLEAIKEILTTHKKIMDSGLSKIATLGNASSEAEAIVSTLNEAITICNSYSGSLEDGLSTSKTLELYNATAILQANYTALINGLNFEQDLLEADGD